MTKAADFSEVLDFWFGAPGSPLRGRGRGEWFVKSDDFDHEVRERFLGLWGQAARGDLDAWTRTPLAALALAVVLDQFPRNMFRGTARAFASDALALRAASAMVERRFDALLRPVERVFVYLPFEHAEDLDSQRRAVELFSTVEGGVIDGSYAEYARRHYEVIARFGRFPHRNAILGRTSTHEEIAFLAQPGSGF
jgi:uncharacterized protein (DUF924 family)